MFVSEGDKFVSLLKLPNPSYHGERFVSDGHKTEEAETKPGVWSQLGDFIRVHNEILTEGLRGRDAFDSLAPSQFRGASRDPALRRYQERGRPRASQSFLSAR